MFTEVYGTYVEVNRSKWNGRGKKWNYVEWTWKEMERNGMDVKRDDGMK